MSSKDSDFSITRHSTESESEEVEEARAMSATNTPTETDGNSPETTEPKRKKCARMEFETSVFRRIKELKDEGTWISKPLSKLMEPSHKSHWDVVLSEMKIASTNLGYFRKWKVLCSKRCAKMIEKHFQIRVHASKRAEEEEELNKRRPFNDVIRELATFWLNAKTLVLFSEQSRIEQLRKKALDEHLNRIVRKTEEYSSMLSQSFVSGNSSRSCASSEKSSARSSGVESSSDDFEPTDSEEDDEETIATADAEASKNKAAVDQEVALLAEESEMPMYDFLEQLPEGYLDSSTFALQNNIARGIKKPKKLLNEDKDIAESLKLDVQMNKTVRNSGNAKRKMFDENPVSAKPSLKIMKKQQPTTKNFKRRKMESSSSESDSKESEESEESSESSFSEDDSDSPEDSDDEIDDSDESESGSESSSDSEMDTDEDEDPNQTTGLANLLQTFDPDRIGNDDDDEVSSIDGVAESFYPKGNTLSSTTVVTTIPFLLKGTLREYQHVGLDWLVAMYNKKLNGILADEMGLGKTIQTIALLAHLACEKGNWGPHLIVVPTSVMLNWELEFKKWCPGFKILTYFGGQKERSLKRQGWTKPNTFHVCITSYNLVVQDHVSFRRKKWKYLILDEAQNIKNFKSLRWQILLNFHAQRRLLLTGTPLQNNLMELWSLMHFLMPAVFQSHREFRQWFSDPVSNMVEGDSSYDDSIIKRLHKVLRPFLLRRLKCEVEKQMPKKYNHVVLCPLSKRQRYLYEEYMERANTKEAISRGTFSGVINVLMQLRKVCNHPNLFEPRPVISPFQDSGVYCTMPTLVCNIIDENKFNLPSFSMFKMTEADYKLGKDDSDLIWNRRYSFSEEIGCIEEEQVELEFGKSPPPKRSKVSDPPEIPEVESSIQWWVRSDVLRMKLTIDVNLAMEKENTCPELALAKNISPAKSSCTEVLLCDKEAGPSEMALEDARNYYALRVEQFLKSRVGLNRQNKSNSKEMCALYLKSIGISNAEDYWPPEIRARRLQDKRDVLIRLKKINEERCKVMPVVGHGTVNMCRAFNEFPSMRYYGLRRIRLSLERPPPPKLRNFSIEGYYSLGHAEAELAMYVKACAQDSSHKNHPLLQWRMTECLKNLTWTVEEQMQMFSETLERFLMYVPAVSVPKAYQNFLRPKYSYYFKQSQMDEALEMVLQGPLKFLHPVTSRMACQFPDSRLIQYDCGKLQVLDRLLRKLKAEDHRVLLFTQMAKMLDVLEAFLNYHGHIYLRLDGSTKIEERQVLMERFNADRKIFCFILSTRSGGVGVNLTGADTVIFYDSDWNPTMDAQAQDRCHRIGQTRDVNIYRLVSERTIEENVIIKSNQKRIIGELAIEGGNFTTAYFKKESIRDIFNTDNLRSNPLELLRQELENSTSVIDISEVDSHDGNEKKENGSKISAVAKTRLFERALAEAEDEIDVNAAMTVEAEAAADLEEFYDSVSAENPSDGDDLSKTEVEMKMISSELLPVERYALRLMEHCIEDWAIQTVSRTKREIEQQEREWSLEKLEQEVFADADHSFDFLPDHPDLFQVEESNENSLETAPAEMSYSTKTLKDTSSSDVIKKSKRSLKRKKKTLSTKNKLMQLSREKRKQLYFSGLSPARKLSNSLVTRSRRLQTKMRSKAANKKESESSSDSGKDYSFVEKSSAQTVPARRSSLSRKAKTQVTPTKEEKPISNKESKSKVTKREETPIANKESKPKRKVGRPAQNKGKKRTVNERETIVSDKGSKLKPTSTKDGKTKDDEKPLNKGNNLNLNQDEKQIVDKERKSKEEKSTPNKVRKAKEEKSTPNKVRKAKEEKSTPNKVRKAKEEKSTPNKVKKAKEEKSTPNKVRKAKEETTNEILNEERKSNEDEKAVSTKGNQLKPRKDENPISDKQIKSKPKEEKTASNKESKSQAGKSIDTKYESGNQKSDNSQKFERRKTRSSVAKEKLTEPVSASADSAAEEKPAQLIGTSVTKESSTESVSASATKENQAEPAKRKRGRPRKHPRPVIE